MKTYHYLLILSFFHVFVLNGSKMYGQSAKPPRAISSLPKLPANIPPPPNFSSFSNKSGKFQLISAEYYSQDEKPFLYKRLIKFDTSTGEAWVLFSKLGAEGERRTWVPLEEK